MELSALLSVSKWPAMITGLSFTRKDYAKSAAQI